MRVTTLSEHYVQYGGTYRTLMVNSGFEETVAKYIETSYHKTYSVTKEWETNLIAQAAKDGYVTCAFGLRLRTPLLKQSLLNVNVTPQAAIAETRTAINAVQQSWGLLNTRAGTAFMNKVRESSFKLDIRPSSQIHDSQYFIVRNDLETLHWLNENLVPEVRWNNDPTIYHEQISLGGNLSVFYPSWDKELEIPNDVSKETIQKIVSNYLIKLNN
jgi:DNA polymerase-1